MRYLMGPRERSMRCDNPTVATHCKWAIPFLRRSPWHSLILQATTAGRELIVQRQHPDAVRIQRGAKNHLKVVDLKSASTNPQQRRLVGLLHYDVSVGVASLLARALSDPCVVAAVVTRDIYNVFWR